MKHFFTKRILAFAILISFACGPGLYDLDEFTSYFMPESAKSEIDMKKYQFSPQFFYNDDEYGEADSLENNGKNENLNAWAKYLNGKVSKKDIENYLYAEKPTPNVFTQTLGVEAKSYIEFLAKTQQATQTEIWTEETNPETKTNVEALYKTAKARFDATKDIFLKERYGYLALRLGAYLEKHQEVIDFYDTKTERIANKTFISDWALSRAAGSRLHLKGVARSFYEFAQIFDRCPSRRNQADLSVRSFGVHFQEKALDFCKNDHEKVAVYTLAAIQPLQEALPFLKKIVELEPNSPNLEFLAAREINRNEFYYFDNQFLYQEEEEEKTDDTQQRAAAFWDDIEGFTLQCADKNPNNPFWKTAAAYASYMKDDMPNAEKLLAEAKNMPTENQKLKLQIATQELLLIAENQEITPELEQKIIPILEDLTKIKEFRPTSAIVSACDNIATKYWGLPTEKQKEQKSGWLQSCSAKKENIKQNNIPFAQAKGFLFSMLTTFQVDGPSQTFEGETYHFAFESQNDQYAIEDTTSSKTLEQVLTFYEQKNPSDTDKRLMKLTNFDENYIYAILGKRALVEHNYSLAVQSFQHIPSDFWSKEPYKTYLSNNPFLIGRVYNSSVSVADLKKSYNPLSFSQKMKELTNKNDADALYLLGCGAYNMGYWGNAWLLSRRSWSVMEMDEFGVDEDSKTKYQDDYYTSQTAKQYFEKALALSKKSEQKAEIVFHLAQIEQNEYLAKYYAGFPVMQRGADYEVHDKAVEKYKEEMKVAEKRGYIKYFSMLKNQYRQTQFQQQVLEECSVYKDFVGK